MGVQAHVRQLNMKHADIDRQISLEMKRIHPDTLRISQLKKEKLQLKDKMSSYMTDHMDRPEQSGHCG